MNMASTAAEPCLDLTELLDVVRVRLKEMRASRECARKISREEFRLAKLEAALKQMNQQSYMAS